MNLANGNGLTFYQWWVATGRHHDARVAEIPGHLIIAWQENEDPADHHVSLTKVRR